MNVIITGASKGIGKAIAEIFAENGHNLFICARGEVELYKTMENLVTRFPSVSIKAKGVDLSIKEQVIAFGEWCLAIATPDILVNNAGRFEPGNVYNEPDGSLENQLAVNLLSAYHLTRSVLPSMIKNQTLSAQGHIFNICSIAALDAYPNGGSYSISKFALNGFTKNLREEMKAYGIKVTAIHPGAVMTDSWEGFDNSNKRIMEAKDIAKMVYSASQLSVQACVEDILIRPQLGDL